MMDMSLLKNPVFLLIGISNVFGMAGLYVPFVYLVDAAVLDVSYFTYFIHYYITIIRLSLFFPYHRESKPILRRSYCQSLE